MRFIFHVGMGKTGSTALQQSLARSEAPLARKGIHYIGMWAPWFADDLVGSVAFHDFMAQPPDELRASADRCLAWSRDQAEATGAHTILHSNEAFHTVPFFKRLAEIAEIRLIAYVRAPARWLPSAYVQWGIVHKANAGPVAPFAVTGRRLMAQYREIRALRQGLGPLLEVRAYPEGGDVLDDFGTAIGAALVKPDRRFQERPSPVETMLRAAFNSGFPQPVLPKAYHEAMRLPRGGKLSAPASVRYAELFDLSEMPRIIEENRDLLGWFERTFKLDLTSAAPDLRQSAVPDDLADGLLGALVDVAAAQAREIAALKVRLSALEARLAAP